jgi:hypothetical protein
MTVLILALIALVAYGGVKLGKSGSGSKRF